MPIKLSEPRAYVALVEIENEPRRNALTPEMFQELADLWPRLASSDARCIVVTGAGDQAFCSGADLAHDWTVYPGLDALVDRALLKTGPFPKPLVAAINGHAVAGGLELILACDLRLASESAKVGFPEVRWGVFPSGGGALKLERQIGFTWARDLLLTGRLITAGEAQKIGLVGQVLKPRDVLPTALEVAGMIAANSPVAVSAVKRFLSEREARDYEIEASREERLAYEVRASTDRIEGVSAFLQGRAPRY